MNDDHNLFKQNFLFHIPSRDWFAKLIDLELWNRGDMYNQIQVLLRRV